MLTFQEKINDLQGHASLSEWHHVQRGLSTLKTHGNYYVKNKYSNFRGKRNNIFQVEKSSSLHLLWHKLMMVILSKSNSASWDVACWKRTLDLFVANVFLVPTFYLLAFSHSLLSDICCHVVRFFFNYFMWMGVLHTFVSVYQVCAWCPGTPEECSTSPGTGA